MIAPSGSRFKTFLLVFVLALLSLFPPISTDMYLSAMDQIALGLHTTHSAIELSLSLFFLGLCVGQLILGPVLDGFGRKGPLLAGTVLYVIMSICLLLANDVRVFNGLRVLQAFGACVGIVVGRVFVTDLFTGQKAAKIMTLLSALMAVGPIISPFAGSVLLSLCGWQSIFVLMILVGLLAIVLTIFTLPETLPREKRAAAPFRKAFKSYGSLLVSRPFLVSTLVTSFALAALFAFITVSSGVLKGVFGLGNIPYGLMFAFVAISLGVFSHINSKLLNHYDPVQLTTAALPVFAVLGVILLLVSGTQSLWVFIVPLWFAMGMVGLLAANGMTITMEAARHSAGVGSALLGGIQFGIAFLCSCGVALIETGDAAPLAWGILVPALAACLVWFGDRLFFGSTIFAEQSQSV